jgi:hypothetical protein
MQVLSRYEELTQCNPADAETMQFTLEVPMSRLERLLPKRCAKCGRIFFSGGKAVISGDILSPDHPKTYICPSC